MKTIKTLTFGGVVAAAAFFQGCGDCTPNVDKVNTDCAARLSAVTDSLSRAWTNDIDSLRAMYDAQVAALDSMIAAAATAAPATGTKKGTSGTKTQPKTNQSPSGVGDRGATDQPKVGDRGGEKPKVGTR